MQALCSLLHVRKHVLVLQVIDHIQSLDGIVVRGNQDDKALAQYVAWKAGKPLVKAFPAP